MDKKLFIKHPLTLILTIFFSASIASQAFLEEVIVSAEKRLESVQDVSQAVTAITSSEIETKNINSMVDLSAIVPGVTVAKNEGYKTIISIRGIGNETNQNAIAAPSVAFHLDGVFIASPFSLLTDFVDIDRIEVIRGPQGTLFGQNSTAGAINVVTKAPSLDEESSSLSMSLGNYNMKKISSTFNVPISESVATSFSFAGHKRDGYSFNTILEQELDDANDFSFRNDWFFQLSDTSSLRIFGQYYDLDRNGSAMKGIDDTTVDPRKLAQDAPSEQTLTSSVYAAIYEKELDFADLKILASTQRDDISVRRDNDRHDFGIAATSIPGVASYPYAEYRFETSLVETTTFEINLVSNEPLMDGKLDWTFGAFYMEHEIQNKIREYISRDDDIPEYVCSEPFANTSVPGTAATNSIGGDGTATCFVVGGAVATFLAELGFVTDAFPSRESLSVYGQTTYSFSDDLRLVSGLRYTEDSFATRVGNFFAFETNGFVSTLDETAEEVTGKITMEYDIQDDAMYYISATRGFKPGGSNLTFGFATQAELNANFRFGSVLVSPLVLPAFEPETVNSLEFGLKADFYDGRARANLAIFDYSYDNLQIQATDPDVFRGGVVNIPESEVSGVELELTGILTDSLTLDANLSFLDTEITGSFNYLDNIDAEQYTFGQEDLRLAAATDIRGNELAKSPEYTADISLTHIADFPSGNTMTSTLQYIYRGEFFQRVANKTAQDFVPSYEIINLTFGIDFSDSMGLDFVFANLTDEDGVNSTMTDVFGTAGTGVELIPPRQFFTRFSVDF
ncbi:TonB-dependent receptor [SAR86 cluster bacterium]|nr:TonB-dependent receptor [SAR86 cluster bacterium]